MDIWTADKLLLFIAFVIPGFVSLKTYQLLLPAAPADTSKQVIDALAYSCINYALLLWPIYEIETHAIREQYPTSYILFYVFVLLIAPVVWTCLAVKLRKSGLLQAVMPHPTLKPWDYVFGRREPAWVVITMKDGKQIAGRYDTKSFASSAPAAEQLYLEECWTLNQDGGFERCRTDSGGILVLSPDMVTVEFFNIAYGDANARQEADS